MVLCGIGAVEFLPPIGVGIIVGSAEIEPCRLAIHGRRGNALLHGVGGHAAGSTCASAGTAMLPAAHLVDVCFRNGAGSCYADKGKCDQRGERQVSNGVESETVHRYSRGSFFRPTAVSLFMGDNYSRLPN